LNNRN